MGALPTILCSICSICALRLLVLGSFLFSFVCYPFHQANFTHRLFVFALDKARRNIFYFCKRRINILSLFILVRSCYCFLLVLLFFTKIRQPQIVFSSRFKFIICFSFGSGLFGVCWENYQQNTGNYNVCQPTPPSPLPILWAPGKKIVEIKEKLFTEGAWPSLTLVYRILKIVPIVQG